MTKSRLIVPVALILLGVVACLTQVHALLSLVGLIFVVVGVAKVMAGVFGSKYDQDGTWTVRSLVAVGVWFGCLAGLLEVIVAAVRIYLFDLPIVMSISDPFAFHLIPIPALIAVSLLVGGVAGWAGLRAGPRGGSAAVAVFLGSWLALLAPLWRFHPSLDAVAAMLLALGGSVQVSRMVAGRPAGFLRLVRRTVAWPLLALVGSWVAIFGASQWRSTPTGESPADAPNVLLLVMDTVRADALGCYAGARPTTPHLDRLADRGVRFARALSTSPWTLPSHSTMFTGHYPHELFDPDDTPLNGRSPLPSVEPTLAEVFAERGYATGGFVANRSYCSYMHGLDRGFAHYEDFPLSPAMILHGSSLGRLVHAAYRLWAGERMSVGRKTAEDVNASFLEWMEGVDDRPFFAFLNYFDAHSPYEIPDLELRKFRTYAEHVPDIVFDKDYLPIEIQDLRNAYDDCMLYLDLQIGALLDDLDRRGVLDQTIVVITSDHGEHFGEHGIVYHGNSLYRALLHVPLMVWYPPSVPRGRVIDGVVSTRDLAATLVGLAGVEGAGFPGRSLERYWAEPPGEDLEDPAVAEILMRDEAPSWVAESWPVSRGGLESVTDGGLHFIRGQDGAIELYDFDRDPEEQADLSGESGRATDLRRLGDLLDALLR